MQGPHFHAAAASGGPDGAPALPALPALILCAGRGERMRPLTDHTPKPLLPVHGKPLIVWQLEALARDGVRDVVVNTAWLAEQFPAALGDGARFGLRIRYSMEGRDHGGALETAGALASAAPLLDDERCWIVAGDAWLPDFRFDAAAARTFAASDDLACLWLVPNPPQHPRGDFGWRADGAGSPDRVDSTDHHGPDHHRPDATAGDAIGRLFIADDHPAVPRFTYSTVGLFHSKLVAGVAVGQHSALRPHLDAAIAAGRVGGRLYRGRWADVGTPARWQALQAAPARPQAPQAAP